MQNFSKNIDKMLKFLRNLNILPLISKVGSKGVRRRMAENGFAPPREFCRHILSCRELKVKSFKKCLHSVLQGVSL